MISFLRSSIRCKNSRPGFTFLPSGGIGRAPIFSISSFGINGGQISTGKKTSSLDTVGGEESVSTVQILRFKGYSGKSRD